MSERYQLFSSKMERRRARIVLPVIVVMMLISMAVILTGLLAGFKPPKHDKSAVAGIPEVSEDYLYGSAVTEFDYTFSMAANLYQNENGEVYVYFTNPIANEVNLKLELINTENGKILYETGYIEPGEYIEYLKESDVRNRAYDIKAKICAYEPETFVSAGTTEILLKLQPW